MTIKLSGKSMVPAIPIEKMTRQEQIDFYLSELSKLGVSVTITRDLANVGRRAAAKAAKRRHDHDLLKEALSGLKRQYAGRTLLHKFVVESEYVVTERLTSMGYIECVRGRYLLTRKGETIGRNAGNGIELHIERAVLALGLTIKR